MVSPDVQPDGSIQARVSVLTPAFEATRAKLLPIPAEGIGWVSWPEEANPYELAVSAIPFLEETKKDIIVDGSIRNFIVDGLRKAGRGARVRTAPVEAKHLRERKSAAEIEILTCVNEVCVCYSNTGRAREPSIIPSRLPCLPSAPCANTCISASANRRQGSSCMMPLGPMVQA